MDEKEFKEQIIKELESPNIPDSQFSKAEQAFNERRAREAGKQKKSKLTRNLSIFVSSAAATLIIVFSIVFWPKENGDDTIIYFDQTTPYQTVNTFQEIKNHTDINIKLPIGFDEEFILQEIRIYYPEENNPCAIEINYRKVVTENIFARLKITIVLAEKVSFYEEIRYDDCDLLDTVNEIDYHYLLRGSGYSTNILAKFSLNNMKYYYESYSTDRATLNSFIISLE